MEGLKKSPHASRRIFFRLTLPEKLRSTEVHRRFTDFVIRKNLLPICAPRFIQHFLKRTDN